MYVISVIMPSLGLQTQRMVYLITYSRADTSKFPTRESFSEAVIEAWKFFVINILTIQYNTNTITVYCENTLSYKRCAIHRRDRSRGL